MPNHHPTHELHTLDIKVDLSTSRTGYSGSIRVAGRSETKRGDLWVYLEQFDQQVGADKGYSMSDALAHIVLACQQDRPRTLGSLNFALRGGVAYDSPTLF